MSPEYKATLRRSQLLQRSATRNTNPLRLACLILALLSTCLSTAVIGTASHAYDTYRRQSLANNPWWLPLWPGHFDTSGTKSLIGAGAGVFMFNLTYIVLCLVPKLEFHADSLRAMMTAVVMSVASGLVALASIVLSAILNRDGRSGDTIQTWTCRFDSGIEMPTILVDSNPTLSNDKFGLLCTESRFAFWAMATVVCLQGLLFLTAITQWITSMWRRYKREDVERPDSGATEVASERELQFEEEWAKHRQP